MATTARAVRPEAARERRFYTRMAWFVAAVVVLGFAPSFYLKPLDLFSYPRPNPPLVPNLMVHGLVFTAWVAVFVAQVSLVSAGRRDLHRKLGATGHAARRGDGAGDVPHGGVDGRARQRAAVHRSADLVVGAADRHPGASSSCSGSAGAKAGATCRRTSG